MMKPLKEYQDMTPAQLLEEPDAPESLKIGAQIALENEREAKNGGEENAEADQA